MVRIAPVYLVDSNLFRFFFPIHEKIRYKLYLTIKWVNSCVHQASFAQTPVLGLKCQAIRAGASRILALCFDPKLDSQV